MRGLTDDERATLNRWVSGDYIRRPVYTTDPSATESLMNTGRGYWGSSGFNPVIHTARPTEMGLLALRVDAIVRSLQGVALV